MTRIPHDSPELENWFSTAKQVDSALAPGPAELDSLGASLSSAPAGSLHGAAFFGAPATKIALSVSLAALAGGLALTLGRVPHSAPPSEAAVVKRVAVSAPSQGPVPSPSAAALAVLEPQHTPLTNSPVTKGAASRPRAPSRPSAATWMEVNAALTEGNLPAARGALETFIEREDGVAKERAELALAQLELGGPKAALAQRTLRRLAAHAEEPSVRLRAKNLLTSPKER